MSKKGLFISVEGGEGVGKTTFIKLLLSKLEGLGPNIQSTREPGGTQVADRIREIFAYPPKDESLSSLTELFLICASRSQHVKRLIEPALSQGDWVLCDRYSDSTRVYQGIIGGIEPKQIESMLTIAEQGFRPDITFLLDCPVPVALERLKIRKESDADTATRYDDAQDNIHEKMRESYLIIQEEHAERIKLIDGSTSTEKSVLQAMGHLKKWF